MFAEFTNLSASSMKYFQSYPHSLQELLLKKLKPGWNEPSKHSKSPKYLLEKPRQQIVEKADDNDSLEYFENTRVGNTEKNEIVHIDLTSTFSLVVEPVYN